MNQSTSQPINVIEIIKTVNQHRLRLIVPALLMTAFAVAYAVVKPVKWEAKQALVVRDEVVRDYDRPGRFSDVETMQNAQETILEITKNRTVIQAALDQVGPPADYPNPPKWPQSFDVSRLSRSLNVEAPNGAEFGKTEVIYLAVVATERERAKTLVAAVGDQLDERIKQFRVKRAESVIHELGRSVELAQADLHDATDRVKKVETEVGSDLSELRILNDSSNGESSLRASLSQIQSELRKVRADREALVEQREILTAALDDPDRLVDTPNQLLQSHPSLRRLKDGLVDSQLRTSELAGRMSDDHPLVLAAIRGEEKIRKSLHQELDVALSGLKADLSVNERVVQSMEHQERDAETRFAQLAGLRAEYSNLVEEVRQRTEIAERAQADLAEARASQDSAHSASLLTRLSGPEVGDYPLGPSRGMIVISGMLGGIATGLGIVFLTVPMGRSHGRRWTDILSYGRRKTDQQQTDATSPKGRQRATDPSRRRAEDQPASELANEQSERERRMGRERRDGSERRDTPTKSGS